MREPFNCTRQEETREEDDNAAAAAAAELAGHFGLQLPLRGEALGRRGEIYLLFRRRE
jgi:hypothetical protein